MKLTNQLHLVPRVRMSGAILLLPVRVFVTRTRKIYWLREEVTG